MLKFNKAHWNIKIYTTINHFYWSASSRESGISRLESEVDFKSRAEAVINFKKFADVNGIKNYRIYRKNFLPEK